METGANEQHMNQPTGDNRPHVSDGDCYRLLRGQIEFEDSLIVQRLNWFVASQSFLFSAYAVTLNAPNPPAYPILGEEQHHVFQLIPVVAMASCVLIYCTVIAGLLAQANLRIFLKQHVSEKELAHYPPVHGAFITRFLGMTAPLGLPLVFAGVWVYLFVHGL
jgi:hypothetical protein